MAANLKHDRSRPSPTEEEDPVETMIKKTGCIELHYTVQECMADHQDWRKCQKEVAEFRKCMTENQKKTKPSSS
ncbi:uncharacterized protein LOC143295761 [Babylonia areolata]|uniref:uncharacterized protein LOC143295761 n=1 Tax=Babylonia areolata TaxID=304850 RepID=UPI003FD5AAEB